MEETKWVNLFSAFLALIGAFTDSSSSSIILSASSHICFIYFSILLGKSSSHRWRFSSTGEIIGLLARAKRLLSAIRSSKGSGGRDVKASLKRFVRSVYTIYIFLFYFILFLFYFIFFFILFQYQELFFRFFFCIWFFLNYVLCVFFFRISPSNVHSKLCLFKSYSNPYLFKSVILGGWWQLITLLVVCFWN